MRNPIIIVFMSLVILFVMLMFSIHAHSHSWYDLDCCDVDDCKKIPFSEVTQTDKGYIWNNGTGEAKLFPYGSEELRHSRDGNYHGCQYKFSRYKRCLYIPLHS